MRGLIHYCRRMTRAVVAWSAIIGVVLVVIGNRGPSSRAALAQGPARTQTLLNLSNFGRMETRTFHASSDWTIRYSMACGSGTTNFSIVTYHGDGSYGDLMENLIAKRISKTQYLHESGDWYLKIDGDCPWRVTFTGTGKPVSTRPPSGRTLLAVSATGIMSTRRFTARGDWTISYTFACRAESSNFSITTYNGNNQYGDLLENLITKRLNKTQYLHERGSWYLKIDGGCPWRVTVRG